MLCEIQIKLTSPWLGDVVTHQKIRRFRRYKGGPDLEIHAPLWKWAFSQAKESLHLNVHLDTIQVPSKMVTPSLRHYTRKFRKKGQKVSEDFEAIDTGTVLTFHIQVHSSLHDIQGVRGPNREELQRLLVFIGRFVGLSPFGSSFDYGRFDVKKVAIIDKMPPEYYP